MVMSRTITSTILLAATATMAFAGSATAATTVKGTVVHTSARSHSFVVASPAGALTAIHAKRNPKVGRTVTVRTRRLGNGTLSATKVRSGARRTRARVRGTVTYVDRARRSFVVSARGVSLVVHRSRAGKRAVAAAAPALPAIGDVVTVTSRFDRHGDLEEHGVRHHGEDDGTIELEGRILAIDPDARTLTLSADDEGELPGSVVVHVPDTFDITAYKVGDELELRATLEADGTYTAVGTSQNGDDQEADDAEHEQGDDGGDDHSGEDRSGDDHADDTPGDATDVVDPVAVDAQPED